MYDKKLKGVPENCILKDVNEIIDKSKIFFDTRGIMASFSDYFRVKLLYEKRGWWIDIDIICLKLFDFKQDFIFSSEYFKHNIIFANVWVIKGKKEDLFYLIILKQLNYI